MKKIRVTQGGCGIKYMDAKGNVRHALKTAADKPFEIDDEQAERLVSLGVAAYVGPVPFDDEIEDEIEEEIEEEIDPEDEIEEEIDPEDNPETPSQEAEKIKGHLDAADLEKMDYNDLKALAADMGVKPTSQKKADIIAALVAVEVEVDAEDAVEDPDDLPELSVADPE